MRFAMRSKTNCRDAPTFLHCFPHTRPHALSASQPRRPGATRPAGVRFGEDACGMHDAGHCAK